MVTSTICAAFLGIAWIRRAVSDPPALQRNQQLLPANLKPQSQARLADNGGLNVAGKCER